MVRPSDSVRRGCEESAPSLALPLGWVARACRVVPVGIHSHSRHLGVHFSGYRVYQDLRKRQLRLHRLSERDPKSVDITNDELTHRVEGIVRFLDNLNSI